MFSRWLIPLIAVGALGFAIYHVVQASQVPPPKPPVVEPPRSPFGAGVSGTGVVEANTDASTTANIAVGSLVPGTVTKVHVKVGQTVKAGDPLWDLDDRQIKADLDFKRANLAAAQAQLARLEAMPRPEEVPPSEAKVREMKALVTQQDDLARRAQRLFANKAIGEEELVTRLQSAATAREQLAAAEANLRLLKAGAWEADKAVARAAVEQQRAQVRQAEIELERLRCLAPADAQVLAVNVRLGEFVGASPGQTLVVLGDTSRLHVRVDIDENDIPRFRPGAQAVARLRGDPTRTYPLEFVRVEPYVVPKRSLTGDNVERVDTRVLQAIYAAGKGTVPLYVGMQLDVFIGRESKPGG
jgi:HlyD family secretion protein